MIEEDLEPRYVISVAARMAGCHAQTLRYYERVGLVQPSRSPGNIRLYSMRDIDLIRLAKSLMDDLGVNLAGVEVLLRLRQRMAEMEMEMKRLQEEVRQLRTMQRKP